QISLFLPSPSNTTSSSSLPTFLFRSNRSQPTSIHHPRPHLPAVSIEFWAPQVRDFVTTSTTTKLASTQMATGGTTTASGGGQSVSTSGSVGSPSSQAVLVNTPASDSTHLRLNHLDIHADDAATTTTPQDAAADNKKKKRGQRAVGADKSGRGLRQFSMKVCEKVESKGTTTYNEVADELVAEFADPSSNLAGPDQPQFDEKNIRRRVYDALNVLMALDIISKDKKEIHWKGLPRTNLSDINEIKAERLSARNRTEKKAHYLQELEDQFSALEILIRRNEELYSSGNAPSGGVSLPFILVQTRPHATVEVEISEDMQLVHFDFNSTPFELHDDNYVLKAMKLLQISDNNGLTTNMVVDVDQGSSMHQHQHQHQHQLLPPIPGILKPRVKHEH
ncbi:Transcription factor-like protein DPB, partial [Linum grandiflorum]